MKAAPFDYVRAHDLDEVCRVLDRAAPEARIIAGGQTLVPLMAMRLARPALLVDINAVAELCGITHEDGAVAIKACTRQAEALASAAVRRRLPLLARALAHVGHGQTRNRGTVGGSIANADPAAEIPLVARTLDAELVARSSAGERRIEAAEFFDSAMVTALAANECLTEIRFPIWPEARTGCAFEEVSIRAGDFALVAAAVQLALDDGGVCTRLALGIGGAAPCPVRPGAIEAALVGTRLDDGAVRRACARLGDFLDPDSDIHASADYRRRVACVVAERAILGARDAARKAAR